MTTPLIMLAILMGPYLIFRYVLDSNEDLSRSRRAAVVGLGALFCFTGVGHFLKTESMALMLPSWVPSKELLVYASGVGEIFLGVLIIRTKAIRICGAVAIGLLILLYPLNVYAALNYVPMGGHAWGPSYLFVRTPLQLIVIFWTYWFLMRPAKVDTIEVH